MILGTCTSLACTTACWICVVVSFVLGGFFGIMTMALVVAARDADDDLMRSSRRERDDDDGRDDESGKDDDDHA